MFTTKPSGINARTKAFVGVAFGYLMAVNVPEVRNYIIPKLSQHPRIAATVSVILAIVAALHNPAVRMAVGITSEADVQKQPDGQTLVTQKTSVVLPEDSSEIPAPPK